MMRMVAGAAILISFLEEFPGILVAPDSVVVGNPSVIQRRVYG